ncbi:hypothetical protein Goarm_017585 [Gossypium armourianum]|uniref:Uncharacterized protein n=1 Tax=Gossypium armourianum TaxID=34283 RepID=A0A7J9JFT0_9ROSI|nr:hypothetical protein [Gossypium armourianum]
MEWSVMWLPRSIVTELSSLYYRTPFPPPMVWLLSSSMLERMSHLKLSRLHKCLQEQLGEGLLRFSILDCRALPLDSSSRSLPMPSRLPKLQECLREGLLRLSLLNCWVLPLDSSSRSHPMPSRLPKCLQEGLGKGLLRLRILDCWALPLGSSSRSHPMPSRLPKVLQEWLLRPSILDCSVLPLD